MATRNETQHERNRFSTMTTSQLRTRLGRISKVDKLLNFANMADEFGYTSLARQARDKFERITGHALENPNEDRARDTEGPARTKPKKKKSEKKGVRIIR